MCLVVIDGWGVSEETRGELNMLLFSHSYVRSYLISSVWLSGLSGNAIKNAATPVMDALTNTEGQYVTVDASGLAVGLPEGLMGNSEVGHFTIGTGRVVYQVLDFAYIDPI